MPGLEISDPRLDQGGGLEEMGIGVVKRANIGMQAAGQSESERQQYNARVQAGNKAGNIEMGAATGAAIGSVIPGIGTALGGLAGSLVGAFA
jgi:phage tail tape-measure protein